jgi:putative membrane protein
MKRFIIGWGVQTVALLVVAHIVPGISIASWQAALLAALVLGMFNAFLRPLLIVLTLPLTIVSMGLFTFVINGFLFYGAASVVRGFAVDSFWSAFAGSLLFSLISFLLNVFLKPGGGGKTPPARPGRHGKVIDVEAVPSETKKNGGNGGNRGAQFLPETRNHNPRSGK